MESVHIDNSDESLAPELSLQAVVALSKSVNAGDEARALPVDAFSVPPIRVSVLLFGGAT